MNKYQKYLISQNKRHKEGIFLFSNCAPRRCNLVMTIHTEVTTPMQIVS